MAQPTDTISPSIYLIADHLDAVLAHGEDLVALVAPELEAPADRNHAAVQAKLALQRMFLEQLRTIETRLVTRVLRAREHAELVRRADNRFKSITDLFISGTHSIADAAADLGDSTALDFTTGRDAVSYLQSRAVASAEPVVSGRKQSLKITDSFRLAGAIELGALLDLAASYLDALELHYDLYGDTLAPKPDTTAGPDATSPAQVPN